MLLRERDRNGSVNLLLAPLLVAACVLPNPQWLTPLLRWSLVAWIGRISYGIYLFHMLAINAAKMLLNRLHVEQDAALVLLSGVFSVAAAAISFRYLEAWFLRWKDRYAARGTSPAETEPPRLPHVTDATTPVFASE